MKRFALLLLCLSSYANAQQLTRIFPPQWAVHAVAAEDERHFLMAGDSGVLISILPWDSNTITYSDYTGFPGKNTTIYGAAYADTLHAVIGGSGGFMAFSNNSGSTWTRVSIGTTVTIRAIASNRRGTLIAAGDSGALFRSVNYGHSWQRLASPTEHQLRCISFGTPAVATAVGSDTTILQSLDSGKTWSRVPFPYDLTSLGNTIGAIDFVSAVMLGADSVWVAMETPVMPLLVIDGHADAHASLTPFPNSGPMTSMIYLGDTFQYLMGFAKDDYYYMLKQDSGWYRAVNYGLDYADVGYDTSMLRVNCAATLSTGPRQYSMIFGGENALFSYGWWSAKAPSQWSEPIWVSYIIHNPSDFQYFFAPIELSILADGSGAACSTGGGVFLTTDYGRRWLPANQPGNYLLSSISMMKGTIISCGWDGRIIRSKAPFSIWDTTIQSGTQEKLHGVAAVSDDTWVIAGDYGVILRSVDTGKTWSLIPTTTKSFLWCAAFADSIGIAAGDDGTVLRSSNGGVTWNSVDNPLSGTSISLRSVQTFSDGTFYVRGGTLLMRSLDYGARWSILSGPSDSLAMCFFDRNTGITASGVSSSKRAPDTAYCAFTIDGGRQWSPFAVPIPTVGRLLFHWLDSRRVLILGDGGFVVQATISMSGVSFTTVARSEAVQVYPNPSHGSVTISYDKREVGPTTIELWSDDGRKLDTLFSGEEQVGRHEHVFASNVPAGAYFIKVNTPESSSIIPVSLTR